MANIELTLTPASPTGSMIFTLGAPGPQGVPGPQGPQGEKGDPGEGVPTGGSSGQVLAKVDGVDYNTEWITVNPETSWGEITGTLSNQTDLQNALDAKQPVSGMSAYLTKAGNLDGLTDLATARSNLNLGATNTPVFGGVDVQGSGANVAHLSPTALSLNHTGYGQFTIQPSQGIVFPDATVQTTAYPGGIGNYLLAANNLSDVTNASTARDNLSLGEGNEVTFLALTTINGSSLNSLDAGGLNISTNGGQPNESQVWVKSDGIQFPDSTIQTTAFPGASGFAPINSPVFTGNPRAPTPATPDNDTPIATTAFVKAQGYITSAPVTSVAGRTGAVTLSNTDISGLGSLAVINDAPSDGTIYGRQNGSWVEAGGGDYLPLAGGAMDANANITASDTSTGTDSEVAGWGLGVQLSADHTKGTTVEFDGLDAYDGASHMQVTPTGITFPDATVQTTAFTDSYLPLAGGSMDNDAQINFPATAGGGALLSTSSLFFEDTAGNEANLSASSLSTGQGGGDVTTITPGKVELVFDEVALPFTIDVNGITFPDATVQTTAFTDSYLPLAGGTMVGSINFNDTVSKVIQSYDDSEGGTIPGDEYYSAYSLSDLSFRAQNYSDDGEGGVNPPTLTYGSKLSGYGLSFVNFNGSSRASTMVYGPTFISFPNGTFQTVAFPGFTGYAQLSGATFTGKVNMAAPTAGGASLNLGVGTAPTTSVAGDIWIGTNINYRDTSGTQKAVANTNTVNTFTQPQVISTSTSSTLPALRITNVSTTAASLVVEDTTNPDTTSLVVDISGNVGIGVPVGYTATQKVEVVGNVKADAFINGTGPTYNVKAIQAHSGGSDTHELLVSVNGSTYRVGMKFVSTP